jgi:hypothetical protein
VGLKASTNIDGITQRSEVQYASRSDIADESNTSVGSDTEGQFGDLRGQFESGNRRLASIFGASDTLDEETHHFVANQLVHDAFIVNQHFRSCAIELVQTLGERRRVRLLTSAVEARTSANTTPMSISMPPVGRRSKQY